MSKSTVRHIVRRLWGRPETLPWEHSASYWEDRYRRGATSGAGSYGRLAAFKAEFINAIVSDMAAKSVVEWGCGDGAQLRLLTVESYIGVDVSPAAVEMCTRRYAHDGSKTFMTLEDAHCRQPKAEIALSLDVIFHLVEDDTFDQYMRTLFESARSAVVIYSSNEHDEWDGSHVRHRAFTTWVESEAPMWHLSTHVPNPYPFSPADPDRTSFCDFFVFRRLQARANEDAPQAAFGQTGDEAPRSHELHVAE